jgi:ABC-type multidrug transport system fused ATPase/permease subunit
VVVAAKFVGAHDFIQRLPSGYDTWRASAAAACRRSAPAVSIARALIRNCLLVLDEVTSALDGVTEQALLANLSGHAAAGSW